MRGEEIVKATAHNGRNLVILKFSLITGGMTSITYYKGYNRTDLTGLPTVEQVLAIRDLTDRPEQ